MVAVSVAIHAMPPMITPRAVPPCGPRRLAVLGAGPVGLECGLYAARLGYDVSVYEAGEIAQHLLEWGHARMFSPWEMNVSALGLRAIAGETRAASFPAAECPGGREFRERYLLPLAASVPLAGRVHARTRVLGVGRERVLKTELIGSPERAAHPFRVLLSSPAGGERIAGADVVVDATGVFSCHNWMGNGGLPAPGERALEARIDYGLPAISGAESARFAGRRTLVVGSGHSAATSVAALCALAARAPGTSVLWVVRGEGRDPYAPIAGDPLPARAALAERAARVLGGADPAVACLAGWTIEEVREAGGGELEVALSRWAEERRERVGRIVANVGYRPERSLYEELQVHECYATQGPIKLAAALLGEASGDCLAQKGHGPETLRNPEPDFFLLGAKSYGRNPNFLLSVGRSQIREVFQALERDAGLDLYAAEAA